MTLKKKWFDLILSGEKINEYRELKEYWTTRLFKTRFKLKSNHVLFRNGYSKDSRWILAEIGFPSILYNAPTDGLHGEPVKGRDLIVIPIAGIVDSGNLF